MIPDPLHPAVVHFPIVLTVVGCGVALVAAFFGRGHLRLWAAVLLALGAVASITAYVTGDEEKEMVGVLLTSAETLLDEHESWAKATMICSIVAAVAATAGALTSRWRRVGAVLRTVTVIAALSTLIAVVQTGHRGGRMVYQHGVGIKEKPSQASGANLSGALPRAESKDRD